jgi:hypothetical protein
MHFFESGAERCITVGIRIQTEGVGGCIGCENDGEGAGSVTLPVVCAKIDAVGDWVIKTDSGGQGPAFEERCTDIRAADRQLAVFPIEFDFYSVVRTIPSAGKYG